MASTTRRQLLQAAAAPSFFQFGANGPNNITQVLPPWAPGVLEIHHISTGRASSSLLIAPDGTTMLIDAGAIVGDTPVLKFLIDPKPNGSLRPGQWIARYIDRRVRPFRKPEIDYFFLTHFHSDHMGEAHLSLPLSPEGYRLTGIADVAQTIPIRKIVDRHYPDYNYPAPLIDPHDKSYQAFVRSQIAKGTKAERFVAGSVGQFKLLREPAAYPNFEVRNIAANGEVWTGSGDRTTHRFPPIKHLDPSDYPTENMCSCAIRLTYGEFDYYSGGDLCSTVGYSRPAWRDIETPVAQACGPVDVAVANHHGWIDACGPAVIAALRPSAFIINAWDSAHPTMGALDNMLSKELYPDDRIVCATATKPESRVALRRLKELSIDSGHIVIRVDAGGKQYSLFGTSNQDESGRVLTAFGPWSCK